MSPKENPVIFILNSENCKKRLYYLYFPLVPLTIARKPLKF